MLTYTHFLRAQPSQTSSPQQEQAGVVAPVLNRPSLERFASVDSSRLELEELVLRHEQTDHMLFNDDQQYKDLMNEV